MKYENEEEIRAEMVVDLYEIRAEALVPFRPGERKIEKIENLFKYNFLSVVIAKICDKYKISHEVIEKVIRDKSLREITPH
jgi:hypothetical protein